MTYDELMNFHEHMAQWCQDKAEQDNGIMGLIWQRSAEEHMEAAKYWYAQRPR